MNVDGAPEARLRALYRDSYGFVRDRARAVLRDEEESRDVAQEVFMRAFEHSDKVLTADSPLGWLLVAATHLSLDRLRHRKLVDAHRASPPPAEGNVTPTRHEQVRRLIHILAGEETLRVRVVLHTVLDGMTQDEAAGALGVSRKTVQRHLDAFRERHVGGDHD